MSGREKSLPERTVIVTGAGRGAGAAAALVLAEAGCRICVNDLNPDRAESTAAAITQRGGEAFAWQADVSNRFQVSAMIEATRDRFTRLDCLVHHAHVSPEAAALKMDEWAWGRTLEVNLTGAFYCAQLCARVMVDEGGGLITFLIKPIGQVTAQPGKAAYATTQSGLMALAHALDREVEPRGVRVRALPVWSAEHAADEVLNLCQETFQSKQEAT
jgi:NAD(P)-dependent dehydrogenase (short-subunit alcohol dehydrogenase family)